MKKLILILALAVSGALSFAQVNGTRWLQKKDPLIQELDLKFKNEFLWYEEYCKKETRFGQHVDVSYIFMKPLDSRPDDPSGLFSIVYNCVSFRSDFNQFVTTLKFQDAVITRNLHLKKGIDLITENKELKKEFLDFDGVELLETANYTILGFIFNLYSISRDSRFMDYMASSEIENSDVRYLEAKIDDRTFVACYYNFFTRGTMTVVYSFYPPEEMLQ